jgi:hypothetical protein
MKAAFFDREEHGEEECGNEWVARTFNCVEEERLDDIWEVMPP